MYPAFDLRIAEEMTAVAKQQKTSSCSAPVASMADGASTLPRLLHIVRRHQDTDTAHLQQLMQELLSEAPCGRGSSKIWHMLSQECMFCPSYRTVIISRVLYTDGSRKNDRPLNMALNKLQVWVARSRKGHVC